MPATALQCKECQAEYPLEARFVCENCFGPLEVAYDFTGLDADGLRRRIDRKSTRLNSSHIQKSRMPSSA